MNIYKVVKIAICMAAFVLLCIIALVIGIAVHWAVGIVFFGLASLVFLFVMYLSIDMAEFNKRMGM